MKKNPSFRLLALKCDDGYIKNSGDGAITNAPLAKASVFPPEQTKALDALFRQLASEGVPGLRKIILNVEEIDA